MEAPAEKHWNRHSREVCPHSWRRRRNTHGLAVIAASSAIIMNELGLLSGNVVVGSERRPSPCCFASMLCGMFDAPALVLRVLLQRALSFDWLIPGRRRRGPTTHG